MFVYDDEINYLPTYLPNFLSYLTFYPTEANVHLPGGFNPHKKRLIDQNLLSYLCQPSKNVYECFPQSLVTAKLGKHSLNKDKSYLARE